MPIDGWRLIAIALDYAHHASGSGYGHLVSKIFYDKVIVPPSGPLAKSYDRWVSNKQSNRLISRLTRRRVSTELRYLFASIPGRRRLVHVLYGEHHSWILRQTRSNSKRKKVMTIHLPPSLWHVSFKRGQLDKFDAIILMSDNQVEPLRTDLGYRGHIEVIPHGVDRTRFSPPATSAIDSEQIRCAMVGNFLRDYHALAEVAKLAASAEPNIHFDVVANQESFAPLEGLPNVTHHHKISDKQLVELYQQSTLGLYLMQDCTANNAVLEAMACGLPIVANDIGGIRTYVDEDCSVLTATLEPEEVIAAIKKASSPSVRTQMSLAARQRAEQFSWPVVAAKTIQLFRDVIAS